ncbi:MarR family winged helix-turn-helix transcriptional regulator [Streptomyces sp. MAR4 CNX-425]|uniref:MarR family winged helix-turn-helix transcriptional regulator n=1 Tax=Streptomyces sp. MAR4 CNX-425 TaxID=3406343 RepID=UPI003B50ED32
MESAERGESAGAGWPERTGRLSYAIFSLARTHRAYAAKLLRDLGLYPGQEHLLMQLLDRDGQSQSELLAAVGLDHSTVSKSLKRMQDAGLVVREKSSEDRRAMRVYLTEAGRAMRDRLEQMWSTLEDASTSGLSEQQVEDFIATSESISAAIVDHHARSPHPAPAPGLN